MKSRTMLVVAVLVIFTACGKPYRATTATVVVTPARIQATFSAQYPDAANAVWIRYDAATIPIDWELAGWTIPDDNDYAVRFDRENNFYYACYDKEGNWIGSSYGVVDYSTMPLTVSTTISHKYPGYKITSVNKEFQREGINYEVELKNSNTKVKLLIDDQGNMIRVKTMSLY